MVLWPPSFENVAFLLFAVATACAWAITVISTAFKRPDRKYFDSSMSWSTWDLWCHPERFVRRPCDKTVRVLARVMLVAAVSAFGVMIVGMIQ